MRTSTRIVKYESQVDILNPEIVNIEKTIMY